jgi:hypothetical protein
MRKKHALAAHKAPVATANVIAFRPTDGDHAAIVWQRIELLERDRALHGGDVFFGPADSLRGGVGGIRLLLDPAGADERVVVERSCSVHGHPIRRNLRL